MKKIDKKAPAAAAPTAAETSSETKWSGAGAPPRGEELDGGDVEEVIKLEEGESATVIYRGYKETKGQKPGQVNKLHKLLMEDGVARGLWGTIQLDSMLAKVHTGDEIWIGYVGKVELPGNKTMHEWKCVVTKRATL